MPYEDYELQAGGRCKALDLIFLLHADHEQNCSTSTVRMVASSQANLFASAAAGVCALWGPLHGGANQAVLEMLERDPRVGRRRLAGSSRRPRTRTAARSSWASATASTRITIRAPRSSRRRATTCWPSCNINDPLLDIAKHLEEAALSDSYFVERKLYPNVDFYSGIIMRAIGIPMEMFTVMFAIGRMPGWIANYKEIMDDPKAPHLPAAPDLRGPALESLHPH